MRDLTIIEYLNGFQVEPNNAPATEWLCCHVPAETLNSRGAFVPDSVLSRLQWDADLDSISY